jgi:hypothetical protein
MRRLSRRIEMENAIDQLRAERDTVRKDTLLEIAEFIETDDFPIDIKHWGGTFKAFGAALALEIAKQVRDKANSEVKK